jgi:hypothetical protein
VVLLGSVPFRGIVAVVLLSSLSLLSVATGNAEMVRTRCPNEASPGFRSYLPDCRAYELVTPAYKEAMAVSSAGGAVSKDGSHLIVEGFGSFVGTKSQGTFGAFYELSRTPDGWLSSPLEAPVIATYPRFEERSAGSDLARSLWEPTFPDSASEDVYLREENGALAGIGPGGPPGAVEPKLHFVGASGDLSRSLFSVRAPISGEGGVNLWPGDHTEGEGQYSLYEYVGTDNAEPQLVGVANKGKVSSIRESHLISQCGTELGSGVLNPQQSDVYNAISQDGSTVFFTAVGKNSREACQNLPGGAVEPDVNEVYARVDNGQEGAHAIAISEPSKEDCATCETFEGEPEKRSPAVFQGASSDGSKMFFLSAQKLLPGAEGENLYEYDFHPEEEGRAANEKVLLVAPEMAPSGGNPGGVARVSAEGTLVYLVSNGKLADNVDARGEEAKKEDNNLYVFDTSTRQIAFIAALSEKDQQDWAGSDARSVSATPNGRFLVFQSTADLTPDEEGRAETTQVFEYDAQTAGLVRVSHGADGYNEDGNTSVYPASIPSINYSEIDRPEPLFAVVSEDGSYVFFVSSDGLTPGAVTGHRSVYEYHAGLVSLISDGHDFSEIGSSLLGADGSGENVFFTTDDQLVPEDGDTQEDIYDARINGGLQAPQGPHPCSGEGCQSNESGPPSLPSPLTSLVPAEPPVTVPGAAVPVSPKANARPKSRKGRKSTRRKKRRIKRAATRRRKP